MMTSGSSSPKMFLGIVHFFLNALMANVFTVDLLPTTHCRVIPDSASRISTLIVKFRTPITEEKRLCIETHF
jgi:hypothetical protein